MASPRLAAGLDPALRQVLEGLAAGGLRSLGGSTPGQARRAFRTLTVDLRRPEHVVPVGSVEDLEVPGGDGARPARLYRPEAKGPRPTVVFFHGGGFVIGDLDTHDNQCRTLCRETAADVLSVDYRLAPEHPWPAGVDDAEAAARWAAAHVDALGGDRERLGVAGDSAGGNLAAVTAQAFRNAGEPLAAQLLIYPAVDLDDDRTERYASVAENAEGYFLTKEDMRWFDGHYAQRAPDRRDPRLSPLYGRPDGLAPAVVATAEFDPLRDAGDAYAARLAAAGVRVEHLRYDGLIHGFFGFGLVSPACDTAVREVCAAFRTLLG